jgi:hypothetical protein
MGKKLSRKNRRYRAWRPKQGKPTAMDTQGTTQSQETETVYNKEDKSPKKHVWQYIFPVMFWGASNYWGVPMLTDLSFTWGYVLFLLVNGAVLGWAIWVSVDWVCRKLHYTKLAKQLKVISAFIAILVFVFTSPSFIGYFVKPQGGIEMPTFVDASTPITVYYGNRDQPILYTKTTIGELEQQGEQVALKINGQPIFVVHIGDNKLYVDALIFAGVENETEHIFSPAVVIHNNHIFGEKPDGWNTYKNNMNLEIDNEDGIPVLIMEYKSPYSIIISGLFVTPLGICKVNNEGGIYELGDTLSELGTYRVDRVFIHDFWDLFRSERTYILG